MATSVDPSRVIRSPDSAFEQLPDFPYVPRHGHYLNLRYAYIDEQSPAVFHDGRAIALSEIANKGIEVHWETYLCLHGQPTWSFLYRRMIPIFLNKPAPKGSHFSKKYVRRRVLAPDYIGFGRSDKPVNDDFYTWDMHHTFLTQFVQKHIIGDSVNFPLGSVIGVVQDWGGVLGFTLPILFPRLFTHLLVMNTAFGLGLPPSEGWLKFRDFIKANPNPAIGALLGRGAEHLTEQEKAAYDAPYPNQASKAGVRMFPMLVPTNSEMAGVALSRGSYAFYQSLKPADLRVFVAIGLSDPVFGEHVINRNILPAFESSTGCLIMKIPEAGHFVQEWGASIAENAVDIWSTEKDSEVQRADLEWRLVGKTKGKL